MAYASLVSLAQTRDIILNPLKYYVSVDAKQKIVCIYDSVVFVLSFLEYFLVEANRFEAPITDAANEAEYTLEYFMWNQIHKHDELGIEFEYQLEKATCEISSIAGELIDIKKSLRTEGNGLISDLVAAILSTRNIINDIVVGLDDDLQQ
ncbi:hypothetical protein ACS0TY_023173 [Phlomoides rotata]